MTKRLTLLFTASLFLFSVAFAQEENDAFKTPVIEDEMTVDAEQNSQWRTGQYKYSAKPKSMWELGIHAGHSFISGDVEAPAFAGYGFGLHLRKSISYVFSLRFSGTYTNSKGYDARSISSNTFRAERTYNQNGGNNGPLASYVLDGNVIHRNYKTGNLIFNTEAVFNLGNILFHKERNKWALNLNVGVGLNIPDVNVDLLNGNTPYNFASVSQGLDLTTKEGRKDSRSNLKDLLDGDYETEGGVENKIIALGDSKTVIPHMTLGLAIQRKLSSKVSLALEHQGLWSDNDLLDGFENRTGADESNNQDVHHYTSVRLGLSLGSKENRVEPLYWLNPLDGAYNDIAELKQRPKFDLTDSDGDGVIDMIDQEKDTPAGSPVDTRGVTLDSDGDGVADYKDLERYSPPGYNVDSDGVAQIPDDGYLTEPEIVDLINRRTADLEGKTNWFLPMIHFDLDKYYVKPEFRGHLHHVATVMQAHPNIKIVAQGYTDNRNPSDYNNVLSYNRANKAINYIVNKYGVPRDRFVLNWGGEASPMIDGLPDNHATSREQEVQHYMNRRVEFRVATANDSDMGRPEGPEAGSDTPSSSRPGTKYSGNRNSGYQP